MTPAIQQRLLQLNRAFYAQIATEFDQTRGGLAVGWTQLLAHLLPHGATVGPIQVLDVGCGNGRFARALDQAGVSCAYVGVDADETLLRLAAQHTADLQNVRTTFVQADLSDPQWSQLVPPVANGYDLVVCLAALHHLPGFALRLQTIQRLAALLAEPGKLAFSNWQFLTSERFAQKQIPWASIQVSAAEVEPGDALLPWQRGGYAVRYVHQIDAQEMAQLAAAANLRVVASFMADGKEGNLNLYTVLQK